MQLYQPESWPSSSPGSNDRYKEKGDILKTTKLILPFLLYSALISDLIFCT